MTDLPFQRSAPVAEALDSDRPVVALESTIITHGMPFPQSLEMARRVEETIREHGATPATVAVLDGILHIGLSNYGLERLAQTEDAMKLSRADFAFAMSQKHTGSTTVAATMIAAQLAGIGVFATGGIGGVHRGADQSFDISADLEELSRTDVIVVCAGAKAILDLGKTLEVLETKGVPVIGYGTDAFPGFWSRDSGLPAPMRLNTAEEIARHVAMRDRLGVKGGTLIANPVPEEAAMDRREITGFIDHALRDAEQADVSGKAVTPYLLKRIYELSSGRSLETNIALVLNNARAAALIAKAIVNNQLQP